MASNPRTRKVAKPELTPTQISEIKAAFDLCDKNNEGFISLDELKVAIRALGYQPTKEEMKAILTETKAGKGGQITFEQLKQIIANKWITKDSTADVTRAFHLFDDDNTGKISFANLKKVAEELGERMPDEEIQEMIDEADEDGDGEIDLKEFMEVMRKANLYS